MTQDRSQPPPGWSPMFVDEWKGQHIVSRAAPQTEVEHAWAIYDRESAPAVAAERARIVEWLRERAAECGGYVAETLRWSAAAIEAGAHEGKP